MKSGVGAVGNPNSIPIFVLEQGSISDFHIKEFQYLSNFALASVEYRGMVYPTVEHAYQAAKTLDFEKRYEIRRCGSPAKAKELGKKLVLRNHWNEIRVSIMLYLLRQKFGRQPLRHQLLATGNRQLVEGNYWNDTFWGVCQGRGDNNLGKLLMQVRSELNQIESF